MMTNDLLPKETFDHFSANYESTIDTPTLLRLGGATSREFIELKCREVLRYAERRGLDTRNCLAVDAGCGTGIAEEYLAARFRKIVGIDLSEGMVREARQKAIPGVEFLKANASDIPLPSGSVQLVFSFCIFHHADRTQLSMLIREAHRLLSPGGLLMIFEHNPYNPLTHYVVRRCPVDTDIKMLAPGFLKRLVRKGDFRDIETRFLIFVPRTFKALLPYERWLSRVPFGGQYAIIARKPR